MNLRSCRLSAKESLTDHLRDNSCEETSDGNSVENGKISFGCSQQCPRVALSPTYERCLASSAFDEMLRSNQTIYIGSMREAQSPMSYNSSEI
ncbi:hypothetical protein PSHT_04044, partial [Puccinia striiformis]